MKNLTQKIRTTGICLITACAIALPTAGHAGWFSDSKPVKKITKKVKATPGNIKAKVEDISKKINEVSAQLRENQPLANALKDSNMVARLAEMAQYMNEYQQDFQEFNARGADELRYDIQDLVNTVTDITEQMGMDGKMAEQLQQAAGMVDKMPAAFLYTLAKSGISYKIQATRDRLVQLKDDLVLIATLPPEKDAFIYPESYKAELCPLVQDKKMKTQLAVLGARLKYNSWSIEKIGKLMPDDFTISVTVVGGGGATIKFPGQYLVTAMETVIGVIEMRIEAYKSIADAMC